MGQKVRFAKTIVQTIEAIQFDGGNHQEILEWIKLDSANFRLYGKGMRLYLEGNSHYNIAEGDWVMRFKQQISVVRDSVIKEFAQGEDGWKIAPVMPTFEPPKEETEEEA